MAPVQVRIMGKDADKLFELVGHVKAKLTLLNGTKNISDNWGARVKKLLVNIDQPRARRAGISSLDIALSLQTTLTGFEVSEFREEEMLYL